MRKGEIPSHVHGAAYAAMKLTGDKGKRDLS